jgi:hypothetical protein
LLRAALTPLTLSDIDPDEIDMRFRLTYAGKLLAHRDDKRLEKRSLHVHEIRREFHQQLANLWKEHPVLANRSFARTSQIGANIIEDIRGDGFVWRPIVNEKNGLICALDILMLRKGAPGAALHDLDNRLKTVFDALRKAKGPNELGEGTSTGKQSPREDENPFFVLLEDDRLITHVSVATDMLLEPVPGTPPDDAVRLVIGVTVRPYDVSLANSVFS